MDMMSSMASKTNNIILTATLYNKTHGLACCRLLEMSNFVIYKQQRTLLFFLHDNKSLLTSNHTALAPPITSAS